MRQYHVDELWGLNSEGHSIGRILEYAVGKEYKFQGVWEKYQMMVGACYVTYPSFGRLLSVKILGNIFTFDEIPAFVADG